MLVGSFDNFTTKEFGIEFRPPAAIASGGGRMKAEIVFVVNLSHLVRSLFNSAQKTTNEGKNLRFFTWGIHFQVAKWPKAIFRGLLISYTEGFLDIIMLYNFREFTS